MPRHKKHTPQDLTAALLTWYGKGHRDLPWRADPSPYHVWLSEIMLQQTRVEAVKAYYLRFLAEVPDINTLAVCEETRLLKLWEGLGYYSRVRNLQKAARILVSEREGHLPETEEELKKLPGIGDYTAAAIASIAFRKRAAAVDGNVLRVMARLHADPKDIADPKTKKIWRDRLLDMYLPEEDHLAGDFNQALMELGATICLPNGEPDCARCPVRPFCVSFSAGTQQDYPVKRKKKARRVEQRTVLLICDRERVAICRRPEKGLLAGLCEYPCMEGASSMRKLRQYLKEAGVTPLRIRALPEAKHIFTHVEWHMTGYLIYADHTGDFHMVDRKDLEQVVAIPSAYRIYTRIATTLLPSYETENTADKRVPGR